MREADAHELAKKKAREISNNKKNPNYKPDASKSQSSDSY
jgi:hypothetical protein